MTGPVPGALSATRSVYEAPAVSPSEMTPEQQEQFTVAQIAAIAAAAGAAKIALADATTIALVPMFRSINPYNAVEIAQFAAKAAERVEMARQQAAKITWSGVHSRMQAFGVPFPAQFETVKPGRATKLDVAYERPAKAYRVRMAAGVASIQNLIAQVEEERFQALGGGLATGENDAEKQTPSGAQGKGQSEKRGSTQGASGGSPGSGSAARSGSGAASGASAKADRPRVRKQDPVPDAEEDDFDPDAEESRQQQLDAEFDSEQALREQARLTEQEKQRLLEEQAQQDAEIRLERMINDDIAMAGRDAHHAAMAKTPARVTGYRRVLHPELTRTGKSCGLCVVASTRVYKKSELMPIHNLCKCEQVEIVNGLDPGDQINFEDLETLYDEAGGTYDGRALKEQDYVVFDHPELGPILRNAKHSQEAIKFSSREASDSHKERVKAEAKAADEKRAEKFGR